MKKLFKMFLCMLCMLTIGIMPLFGTAAQPRTKEVNIEKTDYYIVAEDNQTVAFAAQELKDYIRKITGYFTPVYKIGEEGSASGTPVYLGKVETLNAQYEFGLESKDLKWDGYKLVPVKGGGMAIASKEYRGVIYGVYEVLERVGCIWYGAYEYGEEIPQSKTIGLIVKSPVTVNPDSWMRSYHNEGWYENGVSQANDERLYAYALKMRANSYGRGYSQTIDAALTKYDFIKPAGGHDVADVFLTDAVFKAHPEMFVERNGERVKIEHGTNWCCNPANGTLDFLSEKIGGVLKADPSIKLYQIYGVDTSATGGTRGGWCDCEWCSRYSSADLCLMSIIHIAEALGEQFPDVHFGSIYYHDTLDTSGITFTKEEIPDNVCAIWAAREMCPYHSILDESCAKNVWHKQQYDNLYNLYGDRIYGFLYYGDGVLYNKGVFYKAEQAIEEIQYYTSHGMTAFLELSTNHVGGFMYGITESVVLRLLWDNDFDAESFLEQYKCWMFGSNKETADKITSMLYRMTGEINKYCGYTIDCDTRYIMITDEASKDFAYRHYNDIRSTLPMYAEVDKIFASILETTNDIGVKNRIATMRCHLQMTENVAKTTAWAIEALYNKYLGNTAKCADCFDEAIILLNQVEHIYNSWPVSVKDGNTYWYVGALGADQINLYNWLKY